MLFNAALRAHRAPACSSRRPRLPPPRQKEPSAWDVLAGTLGGLADSGVLNRVQREGAQIGAWSAVHGLAELQRAGALLAAPLEEDSAIIEDRILDRLAVART